MRGRRRIFFIIAPGGVWGVVQCCAGCARCEERWGGGERYARPDLGWGVSDEVVRAAGGVGVVGAGAVREKNGGTNPIAGWEASFINTRMARAYGAGRPGD